MWKGAVSFGMVAIPVSLYLATESKSVSFRSLCPCHKQPINMKRHCSVSGDVLEWKEVLKGFEISKDQFVIIDEEDLDNLPLPSAHTIEIMEFVDGEDIPGRALHEAGLLPGAGEGRGQALLPAQEGAAGGGQGGGRQDRAARPRAHGHPPAPWPGHGRELAALARRDPRHGRASTCPRPTSRSTSARWRWPRC